MVTNLRASVLMTSVLAVGLVLAPLARAHGQSNEPLPNAPSTTGATLQHYQRALELYAQFQQMCAGASEKGCGLTALNGAIAEYRDTLRLKPDLAEAHNDLGNALD